MTAFLTRFLGRKIFAAKPTTHRTRLGVESLDRRDMPSASANLVTATGVLTITGTEAADNVAVIEIQNAGLFAVAGVSTSTINGTPAGYIPVQLVRSIQVNLGNGDDTFSITRCPNYMSGSYLIPSPFLGALQSIQVDAGAGNDNINLAGALAAPSTVLGGAGNDTITGGAGSDVVLGGDGNDSISGGWGNDTLLGGAGSDSLRGDAGTDNTDGVYGIDVVSQCEVSYTRPTPIEVNGSRMTDIVQEQHPYCVLYSTLAGEAERFYQQGRDLASERITFLGTDAATGDAVYQVRLFSNNGTPVTQIVTDPGQPGDADRVSGENWVTLMEKAYLQECHQEDPTGLFVRYYDQGTAMMMITCNCEIHGHVDYWTPWATFGGADFAGIANAVDAGKVVTAGTWNGGRGLATNALEAAHNYTVVGVNRAAQTITLRNPWGVDTDGRPGLYCRDGMNDGLVTVTWAEFAGSMQDYAIGAAL